MSGQHISNSGRSRRSLDFGAPSIEQVRLNVAKLAGSTSISEADILALSPEACTVSDTEQAQLFLFNHFEESEHVNIVTKTFAGENGKPRPFGPGITRTCDDWLKSIENNGLPEHTAGIWVRLNAVSPRGTGKNGAYVDADVVRFRNLLLECDDLTLDEQLTIFANLKVPIASLVSSGGRSIHAVVRVETQSLDEYKTVAKALLLRLRVLGIDRSNSNPSRMTRLPGGTRHQGGTGDGKQRLLYLNPKPQTGGIK